MFLTHVGAHIMRPRADSIRPYTKTTVFLAYLVNSCLANEAA